MQDFRLAFRLLRSRPGFTAAVVIPLALSIACATAVLTLVDAILFRPLGVKDPARLIAVYGYSRAKSAYLSDSFADFRDLGSLRDVVESSAAFVRIPLNADLRGGSERFAIEFVTGGYFTTLGVSPVAGRALGREDDRADAPAAVVVSYALWSGRFERSGAVLGSVVRIAGVPFTVVGVMPQGYVGTLLDWGAAPSFWMPLAQIARVVPAFASLDYRNRRDLRWLMATIRLRPGVTVRSAQATLDVLQAQWRADNPAEYADYRLMALESGRARFFPGFREAAVRFMSLLAGVSAVVLLIACFNLVNLLLARNVAREKETSTRLALGASRSRIVRQSLVESLVLTGCAVLAGLPPSQWLTRWLASFPQFLSITLNLNLSPDPRVLLWSAGASLAAGALIGIVSALRSGRSDLLSGLNNAQARPLARFAALPGARDLFVSAQVACAMVVLIAAVMLARSLHDLGSAPLGYNTRATLIADVETRNGLRAAAQDQPFYRALLAQLRSRTSGAALVSDPLPGNVRWIRSITAQGSASPAADIEGSVVSDGFFSLIGTPVEAGREFTAADDTRALPVAILNHSAASLFWPGQNALGRSIRIAGEAASRVVTGVVADAQYHPLAVKPIPYFFLPLGQAPRPQMMIYVRTPRSPLEFAPVLRRTVQEVDHEASLNGIRTLEEQVESGFAQIRLAAVCTSVVGILGTMLALVGVFAMTAWRVTQQRREIAIRIALGADQRRVVTVFAVKGFTIGAIGAAAGVVLATWTSGLLRSSVGGVTAPGAALFAAASILLLALVFAASIIPARRILAIDPGSLLRVQ